MVKICGSVNAPAVIFSDSDIIPALTINFLKIYISATYKNVEVIYNLKYNFHFGVSTSISFEFLVGEPEGDESVCSNYEEHLNTCKNPCCTLCIRIPTYTPVNVNYQHESSLVKTPEDYIKYTKHGVVLKTFTEDLIFDTLKIDQKKRTSSYALTLANKPPKKQKT